MRVPTEVTAQIAIDESKIDAIFSALNRCDRPGIAVGIAVAGRPVYRKGFGLANEELPVVLSPNTRMRVASISKHFTCFAYLLLCEQGKAVLDDPIAKYIPEINAVAKQVTMRQLMGNISGLRDSLDLSLTFCGFGLRINTDQMVAHYESITDANADPETTWIYNNGGWQLLSVAIERITTMPLEKVLSEFIFEGVGMYDTELRRVDNRFFPHSATAHMIGVDGSYEKNERSNLFTTALAGEGGVVSTVNDMLRWLAHMDKPRIGSTHTWEIMRTPLRLRSGVSTGYAMGLVNGHYRGVPTIYHPGGGTGTNAQMLKVPSLGLDIVVMSNRQDASSVVLANKILDSCLSGLPIVESIPEGCPPSGVFRSSSSGRVIEFPGMSSVPWTEERQQLAILDGMEMSAVRDKAEVWWLAGIFEVQQALRLEWHQGELRAVHLSDFGNQETFLPLRPASKQEFDSLVGSYRSSSTGLQLVIDYGDKGPQVTTHGRFGSTAYLFECLGELTWRARHPSLAYHGGVFSFMPDRSCVFSNAYTRSLCFSKVS